MPVLTLSLALMFGGQLDEIRQKTEQFNAATGNHVTCVSISTDECLQGLDTLLTLSATALFPTANFDLIEIDRFNHEVTPTGYVVIDFKQAAGAMQAFLGSQPTDLPVIKQKTDRFDAESKNQVTCVSITTAQCLTGLDKLLTMSTTPLFPTTHFDLIELDSFMKDVVPSGYVVVDFNATTDEIMAHLKKQ